MVDLLLCLVLAVIAGSIIAYLVHEKKKGVTCVGCPYAKQCAKAKQGNCNCGDHANLKKANLSS